LFLSCFSCLPYLCTHKSILFALLPVLSALPFRVSYPAFLATA
jgi:hypothetical protein